MENHPKDIRRIRKMKVSNLLAKPISGYSTKELENKAKILSNVLNNVMSLQEEVQEELTKRRKGVNK